MKKLVQTKVLFGLIAVFIAAVSTHFLCSCTGEEELLTSSSGVLSRSSDSGIKDVVLSPDQISVVTAENFKTILMMCDTVKRNSPNNQITNADCELLCKRFYSNSSKVNAYVAKRSWSILTNGESQAISSSIDLLPEELFETLFRYYSDPEYDKLEMGISEILNSKWYKSQTSEIQNEIAIDLTSISKIRDVIIEYVGKSPKSRMSPGDRMIWRDIANNATDDQRREYLDATITGITWVTPWWVGVIKDILSFIK